MIFSCSFELQRKYEVYFLLGKSDAKSHQESSMKKLCHSFHTQNTNLEDKTEEKEHIFTVTQLKGICAMFQY
jgi:hypothetical protein